MSSWLDKLVPSLSRGGGKLSKSSIPEGLWKKCPKCEAVLYRPELERNQEICTKCDHHMRVSARKRIEYTLDAGNQEELFTELEPNDPLKFKDIKKYKDRISQAQKATGEKDAAVVMKGEINGRPMIVLAFEFGFMAGSMGSVVGEKFARAGEYCLKHKLPFVCFGASGGARMQEALISLMQMAKTSAVLERMKQHGIPYISVMTDPLYGGVSASLAMLGDLHIAEPNAIIGFAGPRVIEQTVREKLPTGFQRSEFLLKHGAIDMIVHRHKIKDVLSRMLARLSHHLYTVACKIQEQPTTEQVQSSMQQLSNPENKTAEKKEESAQPPSILTGMPDATFSS